jgi:hypothetical protein
VPRLDAPGRDGDDFRQPPAVLARDGAARHRERGRAARPEMEGLAKRLRRREPGDA